MYVDILTTLALFSACIGIAWRLGRASARVRRGVLIFALATSLASGVAITGCDFLSFAAFNIGRLGGGPLNYGAEGFDPESGEPYAPSNVGVPHHTIGGTTRCQTCRSMAYGSEYGRRR
jgi:hypothetical protein